LIFTSPSHSNNLKSHWHLSLLAKHSNDKSNCWPEQNSALSRVPFEDCKYRSTWHLWMLWHFSRLAYLLHSSMSTISHKFFRKNYNNFVSVWSGQDQTKEEIINMGSNISIIKSSLIVKKLISVQQLIRYQIIAHCQILILDGILIWRNN
jgi:hypothetical protein